MRGWSVNPDCYQLWFVGSPAYQQFSNAIERVRMISSHLLSWCSVEVFVHTIAIFIRRSYVHPLLVLRPRYLRGALQSNLCPSLVHVCCCGQQAFCKHKAIPCSYELGDTFAHTYFQILLRTCLCIFKNWQTLDMYCRVAWKIALAKSRQAVFSPFDWFFFYCFCVKKSVCVFRLFCAKKSVLTWPFPMLRRPLFHFEAPAWL